MKKQILFNSAITVLLLSAATALSFCFFYFGNKNLANITVIYILALILIALKTSGYFYGIGASLFCVAAVNFFFSYPYNMIDFSPAGYPVTFIGMLAISIITSTTTTSLKKQRQTIEEREKALFDTEQEKLRANLLRAVSHDLRTPLTTIIGSSVSYLDNYKELSEYERTELITNIKEDSEWLLNMVENLLTVTRIREDSVNKVKKSPEVVEEVVSEGIQRLQRRIPKLQVHVTMPNNFLMIPMDPILIEQVLINLLENAFVHSESNQPADLTIRESEDNVIFSVRDYGVGIDPELLPHIFEGRQYRSGSSDGHRGIGIGLSICKSIIQAHGGDISAFNHDKGVEFIFTLPKEKENEDYV